MVKVFLLIYQNAGRKVSVDNDTKTKQGGDNT